MNEYATLDQFRDFLTSANVSMGRDDDTILRRCVEKASRFIDDYCERRFYPRTETRYYNFQSSRELLLDDDFLALDSLTAGGTAITANYWLYPLNEYPKWQIQMDKSTSEIFNYSGTHQRAVTVVGTWGWHDDWGNAWDDSQDTVQDDPSISATATTLTVADADGADIDGIVPRFSVGQTLKIGTEYLAVTGTSWTANTLTVRRGINGTTAAVHLKDVGISVYRPPAMVTLATWQLAKYLYEVRNTAGGLIVLPTLEGAAIRAEVRKILAEFSLPVRPVSMLEWV